MNRIISVFKITIIGFLGLNLLLIFILTINNYFEGTKIPWENSDFWNYIAFVNLYGIIISLGFGYLNRPNFEKKILNIITICTFICLILSYLLNFKILIMQSIYILIGVSLGRKLVLLIDVVLNKKKPSSNLT